MTSHLISLSALHAAAPGVLDVIFGPEGPGLPEWRCPIWDFEDGPDGDWMGISRYAQHPIADQFDPLDTMFFDCRIPSVAVRLLGLCYRAARGTPHLDHDQCAEWMSWLLIGAWTDTEAARLASLTLTLAPRIAALGGSHA